jgi:branched-chain amino acid transport system permease protein
MELVEVWNLVTVGLLRGGLYALMAIALSLILGVMNMSCMAIGEFYMLGAYFAYFAYDTFGLPPAVAILVAALGSFIAGAVIDRGPFYLLRRRSKENWVFNTFLLTVGLSFFLKNLAHLLWTPTYRGITWYWEGTVNLFGGVGISIDRLAGLLIAVVSIIAFRLFLRRTRTGRAIRAVSQDERGAMLSGIGIEKMYTLTFALACMMGGIAGGSMLSIIPAYPYMGSAPNNYAWLVVMVAGLGNVSGAIFAGFIVGVVEAVAYQFFGGGWPAVVSASILILILLIKPSGIFGSEVKGVLER